MTNSVNKFLALLYLFAATFCWQAYSVDFEIYKRFNLDDNTLNKYFSGLDPENDIDIPEWVNISGQTHNRIFTATPTSDFEQCKDHNKSGIFIRDYLLTNKTYEVIFQWDQRNNIDIYEGQTYEASILRNYVRNGDYIFPDDEDIYYFTPTLGAYCFEFDGNSNVKLAISSNGVYYWQINQVCSDGEIYESETRPFIISDGVTDTDGDGYLDIEELARGADPNDPKDIPLIITSPEECQSAYKDLQYFNVLKANRVDQLDWQIIGYLPEGLILSKGGALQGRPLNTGDYIFAVCVFDRKGKSDEKTFHLEVEKPAPSSVRMGLGGFR